MTEQQLADDQHTPHRPTWDCDACGSPWPCDPARETAYQDPTERAIFMSLMLHEAAGEMPTTPVAELYERFVAWTRTTAS